MNNVIRTLFPRYRPRQEHAHAYTAVLLRNDVSLGELLHSLRFTGIVVTTDPDSGQTVIHRSNKTK